jgi:hypothetical protein
MGLLIGVGTTRPIPVYDYYYGIEWDTSVSNPKPARVGKMELHQSLPLQSRMRRCVLKDDGTVNYYLHPNNSALRDNSAAANLDGTDGMVMVELPDVYVRFEMEGTKRRCLMSDQALPGFVKWSKNYVSAYEATADRTTGTVKLASVANTATAFRGGGNIAAEIAHDADGGTLLGKPATNISLTAFRTYARNRGSVSWNCYTYQIQRKLWWLFAVEYAGFNSQDTFNAALTAEGYRQGGLGAGVTDLTASNIAAMTGGTYACIPCGITNPLGNKTGIVAYALPAEYGATKVTNVPSYRGVENPFGHLLQWTDGCMCLIQADNAGGLSEFYVCDNPANFTSSVTAHYELRGNFPRSNGYVKELILGEYGEIMPLAVGASSTTCFCDYFYTTKPSSGVSERGVSFGGHVAGGENAGFVCAYASNTVINEAVNIGSRLCFIPV